MLYIILSQVVICQRFDARGRVEIWTKDSGVLKTVITLIPAFCGHKTRTRPSEPPSCVSNDMEEWGEFIRVQVRLKPFLLLPTKATLHILWPVSWYSTEGLVVIESPTPTVITKHFISTTCAVTAVCECIKSLALIAHIKNSTVQKTQRVYFFLKM